MALVANSSVRSNEPSLDISSGQRMQGFADPRSIVDPLAPIHEFAAANFISHRCVCLLDRAETYGLLKERIPASPKELQPQDQSPPYFIGIPDQQADDWVSLHAPAAEFTSWCSSDIFPERLDIDTLTGGIRGFIATSLTNISPLEMPSSSAEVSRRLHQEYQTLGRLSGRDTRLREWARTPAQAAATLVQESIAEGDVERLAEVSAILSALGSDGRKWILFGLSFENARSEFYEALFRALRWIGGLTEEQRARAEGLILRHMQSPEPDIRMSAAEATCVLSAGAAKAILANALKEEQDPDVRNTLQERLAELDE